MPSTQKVVKTVTTTVTTVVETDTDDIKMRDFRRRFAIAAAGFQAILLLIYGLAVEYADGPKADGLANSDVDQYYPFYQDVHVMIFIGFGFLMTFLKKYGFSSVGLNFLISCLAIQWAMVVNHFFHELIGVEGFTSFGHRFKIGIVDLIKGDFAAGAVLITFGAVLGKTNALQMLFVVIFEIIVYAVNESLGAGRLVAVDMGGSIFVHTFGAYFGLGLSYALSRQPAGEVEKEGSTKNSDMFAMIGTLFLWMFWPSFNGALATEDQQYRVVINTVIALSACCVTAFLAISFFNKEGKFDMVSIQNATLAGGVAVGSSSDLVIEPWGAMLVGMVAGVVSVWGYEILQPCLARNLGLHDTCGVHNLHGMPGVIGAIGGAISAASAGSSAYGQTIAKVFPARAPTNATEAALLGVAVGKGRTAGEQAAFQLGALFITLAMAVVGGLITGCIIKLPLFLPDGSAPCGTCGHSTHHSRWFEDKDYWVVEGESDEESEGGDEEDADVEAGNGAGNSKEVELTAAEGESAKE